VTLLRASARPAGRQAPPGTGHQDALDGLRALAAAAVIVTHVGGLTGYTLAGTPASWVVSRGNVGVPIFFVLSGLLLYRPWAAAALAGQPLGRLGSYLRRRALRILPAYWVVVLVALPLLNPGPARHAWPWVQYLLLVQNYDAHPWWAGTGAAGLAQDWSLVVEVSFYLVLPVLAALLAWHAGRAGWAGWRARPATDVAGRARRLLAAVTILGLSSFGWTLLAYYPRAEFWFNATLPPMLIWFAAGMAIAVVAAWAAAEPGADGPASQFCRAVASSPGMCFLISGCAFAIACTPAAGPAFISILSPWSAELRLALFTVVAVALVAPVAFQPALAGPAQAGLAQTGITRSSRVLGSPVPRFLGKVSYGIFLWQLVIGWAFFTALRLKGPFQGGHYNGLQTLGILAAVALLSIAAATLSYYLVEVPARRLGRMRWPGRRRSGLGQDQRGGQPGHHDQADELRDRVPQVGHEAAGVARPEQPLADDAADQRGQQQGGQQPGPGELDPDPADPAVAGRGHEQPGGDGHDGGAREPAQPETG
jgi:peptidoglycan/LPS O-acetylase OafA/YrhL